MGVKGLIASVLIAALFLGVLLYSIFDDPVEVEFIDTGDPKTSLKIIKHLKTGERDYIYGVIDGMGNSNP